VAQLSAAVNHSFKVDGQPGEAQIVALRPSLCVRLGEQLYSVTGVHADGAQFEICLDGIGYRGWRCTVGDVVHVRVNGRTYLVHLDGRTLAAAGAAADNEVRASMPGVVVAVHCEPGQQVQAGDQLLTLESMKLQVTVVASHAARVQQVHVATDTVFERGALLVSLVHEEMQQQ
jgi:acetyl/propionyl-CoA carboxylase alpha subunit